MTRTRIFTAGFTRSSAEHFFTRLRAAGVRRVIDVRLNNTSQLAGFAKQDDLRYFVRELLSAEYLHLPELAPTPELLDAYKKQKGAWSAYERAFNDLLGERRIERSLDPALLHDACLLCSEHVADHCHRRLVAEYLARHWPHVEIHHL